MTPPRVSSPRALGDQQTLWSPELPKTAQRRVFLGDCLERIAAALSGATRLTTQAYRTCPDLCTAGGDYLEVKGWHGGTVYLFKHRLDADWRLVETVPARVTYLFFRHSVRLEHATTQAEMWSLLASRPLEVLAIPVERLRARWRWGRKAMRHCRDGQEAVAVAVTEKQLRAMAVGRAELSRCVQVGGVDISLTLRGTDLGRVLRPLTAAERETAAEMLAELSTSSLRVALAPAPAPRHPTHRVRVVESRNPGWYSRLADTVGAKKRRIARVRQVGDTDLRRGQVLSSLDRLSRGICFYPYDHLLHPVVLSLCARGGI